MRYFLFFLIFANLSMGDEARHADPAEFAASQEKEPKTSGEPEAEPEISEEEYRIQKQLLVSKDFLKTLKTDGYDDETATLPSELSAYSIETALEAEESSLSLYQMGNLVNRLLKRSTSLQNEANRPSRNLEDAKNLGEMNQEALRMYFVAGKVNERERALRAKERSIDATAGSQPSQQKPSPQLAQRSTLTQRLEEAKKILLSGEENVRVKIVVKEGKKQKKSPLEWSRHGQFHTFKLAYVFELFPRLGFIRCYLRRGALSQKGALLIGLEFAPFLRIGIGTIA